MISGALETHATSPKGNTGTKLKTRSLRPTLGVSVLLTVLYGSRGFSVIHAFPWWFCAALSQSLLTGSFPLKNYKKLTTTETPQSLGSWSEKCTILFCSLRVRLDSN